MVGMDNSGVNQSELASFLVTQGSSPCPYYAPRHEGVLGNACVECWADAFYRFSNLILPDKGKCADKVPIPLTARSKTLVGGRSLDGTADANPVEAMSVSRLWVQCVVRYRLLRRADHQSREVIPVVVCESDRDASIMRRLRSTMGSWAVGGGWGWGGEGKQAMKALIGVRGTACSLTSALEGGGWSTRRFGHFTLGKDSRYP